MPIAHVLRDADRAALSTWLSDLVLLGLALAALAVALLVLETHTGPRDDETSHGR